MLCATIGATVGIGLTLLATQCLSLIPAWQSRIGYCVAGGLWGAMMGAGVWYCGRPNQVQGPAYQVLQQDPQPQVVHSIPANWVAPKPPEFGAQSGKHVRFSSAVKTGAEPPAAPAPTVAQPSGLPVQVDSVSAIGSRSGISRGPSVSPVRPEFLAQHRPAVAPSRPAAVAAVEQPVPPGAIPVSPGARLHQGPNYLIYDLGSGRSAAAKLAELRAGTAQFRRSQRAVYIIVYATSRRTLEYVVNEQGQQVPISDLVQQLASRMEGEEPWDVFLIASGAVGIADADDSLQKKLMAGFEAAGKKVYIYATPDRVERTQPGGSAGVVRPADGQESTVVRVSNVSGVAGHQKYNFKGKQSLDRRPPGNDAAKPG